MNKHNHYTFSFAVFSTVICALIALYAIKHHGLDVVEFNAAFDGDSMEAIVISTLSLWTLYFGQRALVFFAQHIAPRIKNPVSIDTVAVPAAAVINTKRRIAARIAERLDK